MDGGVLRDGQSWAPNRKMASGSGNGCGKRGGRGNKSCTWIAGLGSKVGGVVKANGSLTKDLTPLL